MRHASSPREVRDKQIANTDNSKPERQLDESGRKSAIAMGKALRDLRIPIGNVLSSPTYRALETVRLAQFGIPHTFAELGITVKACRVARLLKLRGCSGKWRAFPMNLMEGTIAEVLEIPCRSCHSMNRYIIQPSSHCALEASA